MTAPRQVLPGSRYLVTRRCTQRQFWLKPSALTNQIVAYCIAVGARLTNVQIHAVCVLSNHWHCVITDPDGQLPAFLHWVHKYIAKCINASYGRWENLWASEPPSAVRLEDDADVLDKIAYCLTNPVSAGLVPYGDEWPGLRSEPGDVAGRSSEVTRPPVYFRERGPMPAVATLELVRPTICGDASDDELAARVTRLVAEREAELRKNHQREGRRFLGVTAILRQKPDERPGTVEPRRTLSPRIAAKNKWLRLEAIRRVKSFLVGYRDAFRRWREGERDVIFPPGTYAMRIVHGAVCAEGP